MRSVNAPPTVVPATQAMYDLFCCYQRNETTGLEYAHVPGLINAGCFPSQTCATIDGKSQPYAYYSPQSSSLFAWMSNGNNPYNAGQFSVRRHSGGLGFDLNYTSSKPIDLGTRCRTH